MVVQSGSVQPPKIGDLLTSFTRQYVPLVVGVLVGWLARHRVGVDTPEATAVLTAVVTAVFYAVARLLETYASPAFGFLLGVAKAPAYAPGPPPQPEPAVVGNTGTPGSMTVTTTGAPLSYTGVPQGEAPPADA